MTKLDFVIAYNCALDPADPSRYLRADLLRARSVEHVTLQTGGSWGSAVGAYVGGEHTAPIPFTGWAGA